MWASVRGLEVIISQATVNMNLGGFQSLCVQKYYFSNSSAVPLKRIEADERTSRNGNYHSENLNQVHEQLLDRYAIDSFEETVHFILHDSGVYKRYLSECYSQQKL